MTRTLPRRMLQVAALALALVLLFTGCMSDGQNAVHAEMNADRAAYGLRTLPTHGSLNAKAQAWAEKIARDGRLSHSTLSASVPSCWRSLGENVGYGTSAASVQDAYMNSSGHRANILGDFTRVGVGVTVTGGKMWVTEDFGKYPNDPVPSTTTTTTSTTPPPTTTTTAPSSSIGLTVTKGTWDNGTKSKAILTWSGASGTDVDVWRNGAKLTTTANDGGWNDKFSVKLAAGTVRNYKVCRAGTTTCSATKSVTF